MPPIGAAVGATALLLAGAGARGAGAQPAPLTAGAKWKAVAGAPRAPLSPAGHCGASLGAAVAITYALVG